MPEPPADQPLLQRLGFASILAIIAVALPPIGGFVVLGKMDAISQWLDSHSELGPVIYTVAFAALAGLALLPTYAQSILGGWAFSLIPGFPAALAGFTGGAILGYGIARPTSSERVTKVINEQPKWAAVRDALLPATARASTADSLEDSVAGRGTRRKNGALRTLGIVTLLRLPPNSPFAITNLVLASVRVPLWIYVAGTVLGMAPRTFAAVWLGHAARGQFSSLREGLDAPKPWWLFAAMVAGTLVVLLILGAIGNHAIRRVTTNGARTAAPSQ